MNLRKNLPLYLAAIPVIAALHAAAAAAGIKTYVYLWELLIDGRTVLLAGLLYLLLKPAQWRNDAQDRGVFRWSIAKNAGAFLIPVLLTGLIAAAGLLVKKVQFADPENGTTLALTTLFDIPAIFIFSVTTVFVEEYIFRGWILTEFERSGSAWMGFFFSSVLWAVYALSDLVPLEDFAWTTLGLMALYYCAVGIAASALYYGSRSLWVSYSFRIGVMTLTPLMLTGAAESAEAFFSTENPLFFGDGIIASAALMLLFGGVFLSVHQRRRRTLEAAVQR
ncbi:MAG: lysostaphin resistance A-like protein [Acidobacteriota bacterium]